MSQRQYDYVVNFTLTSNQTLTDQPKTTPSDAVFVALGVSARSTGDFQIRMRDNLGQFLSNDMVDGDLWAGTANRPRPFVRPLTLNKTQALSFDIADLSGSANDIQIVFHGYLDYAAK